MKCRHFLSLKDLSADELRALLTRAGELKAIQHRGNRHIPLQGKTLGMIFEKASTRTRVSFEVGMAQLGGHALFLSARDTQLERGEPVEDTARVLSRMVDIMMVRTFAHQTIEQFAAYSSVPIINGLSDQVHPCQLLADLQTFIENRGSITGRTVAWIGDGNNMCHSWINAATLLDFQLHIASPPGYEPDDNIMEKTNNRVLMFQDPKKAVQNVDLIVTDVWTSMGQEKEKAQRTVTFADYQINQAMLENAAPNALFMHCLPAHRGEEVTADVIDGPQSVVWDEAENRLHAQKALLEFLLDVSLRA